MLPTPTVAVSLGPCRLMSRRKVSLACRTIDGRLAKKTNTAAHADTRPTVEYLSWPLVAALAAPRAASPTMLHATIARGRARIATPAIAPARPQNGKP